MRKRVLAIGVMISAAGAGAANAACTRPLATVFSAHGDQSLYTVVPGGDVETGAAGWTLTKASVVAVADPANHLNRGADAYGLQVSGGGSAVSPPFCVTSDFRGLRLFSRTVAPASSAPFAVDLLYRGVQVSSSTVNPGKAWQLSACLGLLDLTKYMPKGTEASVQIRIGPPEAGGVQVDDVYADPRMR